ncbi:ComEA family DNA-binding protein [Azohydromonas aeria]|uniref:ComEA family DNA-binding protein n=1 Tax=Azohydromonas aeria TaxID=2590212 RepID=UPI0012FB0AA7|nr:helix-hairpin-helix domain-containing protein [Azohydromonas aeria]
MPPPAPSRTWRRRPLALALATAVALLASARLPAAPAAPLDVNTATQAQLEQLRGIGVAMSERLLSERARQPFSGWSDLVERVPGIGARGAARLSQQGLRVDGQPYEAPAPR